MKTKIFLHIFFFVVFCTILIFAQNNNIKETVNEKAVKKVTVKGNSTGNIKTPQVTEGNINFKDENGNSLITITDEGTTGSITIPSAGSAPPITTNKLYNVGSTLYFNGGAVGSGGGAASINGLSDAKTDVYSVFLGSGAGASDVGGNANTAVGILALHSNTSGIVNTASGYKALYSNTTGNLNTSTGNLTLFSNTTGAGNTANGYAALYYNTIGADNTANGTAALDSNTTGNNNTAIGYHALYRNSTGSNNTAVGYGADVGSNDLTNATAIGNGAVVSASNTIQLGNSSIIHIYAKVGITATSDSTKKENFLKVDGEKVLEKFSNFNLRSWNFKGDNPKTDRHYGIMAQDFFSAFGHDAIGTIGNDTTVSTMDMNGINMIAIQALEKRTTEQDKRLKIQDKRIEELEKQNKELSMQNAEIEKQNTEIKNRDEKIKNQNEEIKNEFESIKLVVNKLANEQKINITYK